MLRILTALAGLLVLFQAPVTAKHDDAGFDFEIKVMPAFQIGKYD